jgi:uncharacterized repeat protein (TIGR03803 family)
MSEPMSCNTHLFVAGEILPTTGGIRFWESFVTKGLISKRTSDKGGRMLKLNLWKTVLLLGVFCLMGAIASPAQTFEDLVNFNGANGEYPYYGSLVQGPDGNFYGTTLEGGAYAGGTVFKVTAEGTLTTLYSFCTEKDCADGKFPKAGLVLATNGNFYGTTSGGGTYLNGTIFKITVGGTLTTLYSFCPPEHCATGAEPVAGLVQAANGDFYGTTEGGGANFEGTVFEMTPAGELTTLYSFCALKDCADGSQPYGDLIQATNGNFYGTTSGGGTGTACGDLGCGTVFEITPAGVLTTYSFDGTDGKFPMAGLVQATNGNFYGTTTEGGAYDDGTVFEMTPAGVLTTLHSFHTDTDGGYPYAPLIQATDGNFYGTTYGGTVFKITAVGTLTTLYTFVGTADGDHPQAGLLQATNGILYGTTTDGGPDDEGTVFSLSVGLGPFVETNPTSGKVGTAVTILGNNLTGSTSVTFNGIAATFKVISGTGITTTVPESATTGPVKVTTPSGTLTSDLNFRVP